jgi:imidazole glycerol-phosphate synthase subunit HisH
MEPIDIVIVDYGMGNIRSVHNAFVRLGCKVTSSDKIEDLEKADALILPGVGAFGEAVGNLASRNLFGPLIHLVREQGMPILGICLGMQLLAERSNERGSFRGLGLIPGEVRKIEVPMILRLPHVGWNSVYIAKQAPLFKRVPDGCAFYFVHSYHFVCDNKDHVAAITDYGDDIVAAVQNGCVYGVQFHPERSQTNGLALLENFIDDVRNLRQGEEAC